MIKSDSPEKPLSMDGFVIIDKPKGPTSHQVDHWVRQILGVEKVGHVGTLDPNAAGLLVMAIGKAVKLIDVAHEDTKEYICAMRVHSDATEDTIRNVMEKFQTEVYQIPPMKSAVAREVRSRRIYELELLEKQEKMILFRARTDSGTYIRTLCVDMGYFLGTGAQMADLRRISTGVFREDRMITLQDFKDSVELMKQGDDRSFRKLFLPMNYLFRDKPKIIVKKSTIENIAHGADLYPGGIKSVIGEARIGDRVCVLSENNELVGTGRMLVHSSDISELKVVDFDRVMVEPERKKGRPGRDKPPREEPKKEKVEVFHEKQKKRPERTTKRDKVVRNSGKRGAAGTVQRSGAKLRRDFRYSQGRKTSGNGSDIRDDSRPKGKADKLRKKKDKR